jgi:hypothetical protein
MIFYLKNKNLKAFAEELRPSTSGWRGPGILIPDPLHPSEFYMTPALRLAASGRAIKNERGLKKDAC